MNLDELLPDYISNNYRGRVAVEYGYDGEFHVKEINDEYDLMLNCLQKQDELWENGNKIVGFETDWCQFARDIFEQFPIELRKKIAKQDKELHIHLPNDLIEKYG